MNKYYLFFNKAEKYPGTNTLMTNYWVEFYAKDMHSGRIFVDKLFPSKVWQYFEKEKFVIKNKTTNLYPKGCYKVLYNGYKVPRINKFNMHGRNRITNKRKTLQRSRL